mgnify:FL=1
MTNNKEEILSKYLHTMPTTMDSYYLKDSIPSKKLNNAINSFASGVKRESVIGLYDTTLFGSSKEGIIFSDTKFCSKDMLEKPIKIWYDDIKFMKIHGDSEKDNEKELSIELFDGSNETITNRFINKTPLYEFLNEMIQLHTEEKDSNNEIKLNKKTHYGSEAGGIANGTYNTVNKLYDEEKFRARQGHGFAAERVEHLYDKLTGHDAKILGDDNIKNGADRIVDGTLIQSKCCRTGRACINECYDKNGNFRYLMDGKPMKIEVPSDKFDGAVKALEEKIRDGNVPGVTNPAEAKNIVKKGHFTYNQIKNIAKAGTIESITYDSVNGVITSTSSFGITATMTLATSIWNGEDVETALRTATYSGLKVGGTAFVTTVMSSQLSKAGLNSTLVGSSEVIVSFMGPKASAVLINAFRTGKPIYGAAAMKSAAKLLRSNAITAGVTVIVLSSADVINIFRGRISGKQLFKNFTSTISTVGGGTGGWIAGAAAGSAILPGVGTVIGGLIGSVTGGTVAGKVNDAVVGNFIEDDADEMVKIIQDEFMTLAEDYLLNQKEAEKSIDKLSEQLDGTLLKDMFASDDREEFARSILVPIVENEIKKRKHIGTVSDEVMLDSLKMVLEEISEEDNSSMDS